jgi:hypothetical protein
MGKETNLVESCDYHYLVSEVLNKSGALKCFQCKSGFVVNHESTACELATNDWFIGCRILGTGPEKVCNECLPGYFSSHDNKKCSKSQKLQDSEQIDK